MSLYVSSRSAYIRDLEEQKKRNVRGAGNKPASVPVFSGAKQGITILQSYSGCTADCRPTYTPKVELYIQYMHQKIKVHEVDNDYQCAQENLFLVCAQCLPPYNCYQGRSEVEVPQCVEVFMVQ